VASIYERIVEVLGTDNGAEIGRMIGVERQSVYRWRDADTVPSRKHIDKIIKCSGVTLDWLMTGEGAKYPTKIQKSVELTAGTKREGNDQFSILAPSPLQFHSLSIVAELVNNQLNKLSGHTMNIPKQLGSEKSVLILVQTDDWQAEGIRPGDLIVAEVPNGQSLNGRTVIAVCDGRAIIRKFEQRGQLGCFTSLLFGTPFSFPMESIELAYLVIAVVHNQA